MTPSEKTAAAVALLEELKRELSDIERTCSEEHGLSLDYAKKQLAKNGPRLKSLIAFLSLFESGEYVVAQKIMMPPMTRLPPEFEEALYSNLDSLYES